ncbi:MAG TPA: hypothetical protein VII54_00995 [Gaiellaceae bacterium]|jgi:hypothetical protein
MRRLALLLLVLPLAACGGGSKPASSASPLDVVKAAAQKTYAAGSEALALTANVQVSGQAAALSGTGSFDTKSALGSMHLNVKAGPIATTVDEVLSGTAVYLKSPLLVSGLPGGKTWVKLDLAKVHVSGLDLQSLLAQNPGDQLKQLQALKSATKVGTDQIGTHYKVQAATGTIRGYDVWVGNDGYIHRVVVAESSPKVSVTIDLSNFGEKVTAAAPPAAQVYESKNGSIPGLGGVGA